MGAERARREHPDHEGRANSAPSVAERPIAAVAASTRTGPPSAASVSRAAAPAIAAALAEPIDGTRVQPRLEVGAVDDPAEREAEATADTVMRGLEPGVSSFAPPTASRVSRATDVGAEGGTVSSDLERSISSSSGAPLPGGVRTRMEGAFGADFSGVRVHADSPAASRIQARAFTHGSDVHFAPGQFQPGSPGGQHLLAHELTHVVQQSGGVHRLMWDQTTFDKQTSQAWTTKSTAQKEIRTLLADYHTRFPFGDLDETTAKSAYDAVTRMKLIADAYLAKNVKTMADGEEIARGSRSDRIAGMKAFSQNCQGELNWLTQRLDRGKDATDKFDTGAATMRVKDEAGVKKITDHYSGDAQSCFRKLGKLIEAAAPGAGDSAGIALEVQIPVTTGVTVNLGFGAEVERGDSEAKYAKAVTPPGTTKPKVLPVEVGFNVYAGVGGNVGPAASVAGTLGGYMRSRAQSGADAAELLSYALFRRGRSSSAIPREVVNFMWGEGNADKFGWQVAEAWSLGVEKRILDSMGTNADGDEINENFVESGGFGKASAEVGIDKVAKLEFEAEAYQGTRIDATSLKARKGGAGMDNRESGRTGRKMTKQADRRGVAQKDVGRTTRGFRVSAAAGNDMLSGRLEFAMRWISDGAHGKKTYKLSEATLGGEFSFTMPGDQLVGGGIGNLMPTIVEFANRMIAQARSRAAKEEGTPPGTLGNVGHSLETAAMSMAQLATAKENWAPPTKLAEDSGGFSSSTAYTIGLEFDLTGPEFTITISQDKSSEIAKLAEDISKTSSGAAGVKFEMTKSTRLLEIKFSSGKPVLTWAGGTTGE